MAEATRNSRNLSNDGNLAGVLKEVMGKFLQGTNGCLPAVVAAYDPETNRATVKPLIQQLKTDNTVLDRAEVASVPVFQAGGGNAVLRFHIIPGDLGWIKACDRDISLFMQSMKEAPPNTLRIHDFSDSIFFPDQFKKWTLSAASEGFATLQTLDGKQEIVLLDDRIHIRSDLQVFIDTPTTVTRAIVALANILTTADTITSGKSFLNHTHSQPQDSAGNFQAETNPPS